MKEFSLPIKPEELEDIGFCRDVEREQLHSLAYIKPAVESVAIVRQIQAVRGLRESLERIVEMEQ